MKSFFYLSLSLLVFVSFSFGQIPGNPEDQNSFQGGLGMTWIDGKSYTTFTIAPDFSLGKFGVGLNIELLFDNSDGFKFRKAGWKGGAGVFRAIRYLRYGHKRDPFYARIGTLDAASLGHGTLMWYYTNASAYDDRKIGLEFDLDFDTFGFETVTSNLARIEVIGGRLYYRPLLATGIPVIKKLEFGGTYVTDIDPDGKRSSNDEISGWGLDVGLPVIETKYLTTLLYYDFAQLVDYGSGHITGIEFGFPALGSLFNLSAKLEKRFLGAKFLPNYFNPLYEIDRNAEIPKAALLENVEKTEGIFGQLAGTILSKIQLVGNYQQLNNIDESGVLHLHAGLSEAIPNVLLKAAYDKAGIEGFDDAFSLDERSLATAEIGYRTFSYFYVSMLYRWTFEFNESKDKYVTQKRVEPRISFVMNF